MTNNPQQRPHVRTCPLCEAMCGVEVHTHQDAPDRVRLIRPNRNDVWSKGYICPKGTTLGHLHHDPDRLRTPLVRNAAGEHVTASWDAAFERCAELMAPVLAEHTKSAVTAYIGNPAAHNYSISRYVGLFTALAGLPMIYSAGTVDQWPKNVTCALMYGHPWRIPAPDLPRTDFIVIQGANPHASQGSLLACADVIGELERLKARGGHSVVIDPRRTGTAQRADQWLPIRPGTDALLQLGVLNVLFAEGLVNLGRVADRLRGVDELRALAADFTPQRVAGPCGTSPEAIRDLARSFAAARRAAWYARIGTCNQEFGTLASWLPDVLCALTANLDEPGGLMWAKPVATSMALLPRDQAFTAGRWRSRVRGAPEVLGQVPVSCLAEEIDTPGEGQIRALVMICGNPVISAPDAGRLDSALPLLDCMISMDNALNETSRHAHVVLPGLSPLEQPHYDELLWSWAMRSAAKWSPALFPPSDGRPHEWEILIRLGAVCAGMDPNTVDVAAIDNGYFSALAERYGVDPGAALAASPEPGPERINDLAVRAGPWGDRYDPDSDGLTLEKIKAHPDGIDMGPMVSRLDEIVLHDDGKVDLAPAYITADLERLRTRHHEVFAAARSGATDHDSGARPGGASGHEGLLLVSRRHLRSNNSWMHNVSVLVSGKDRCTLLIHPSDAAACGVVDGSTACVTSVNGSVEVPVEVSDEMMPGVVSLPHGWGHDKPGTLMSVAREHAGVNNNLLAPATFVDVPSGNAAVNGIPVEVVPAA